VGGMPEVFRGLFLLCVGIGLYITLSLDDVIFMCLVCEVLCAHLLPRSSSTIKLNWQLVLIFERKTNCNGEALSSDSSDMIFEFKTKCNGDLLHTNSFKIYCN
jgi:hypothetical protein